MFYLPYPILSDPVLWYPILRCLVLSGSQPPKSCPNILSCLYYNLPYAMPSWPLLCYPMLPYLPYLPYPTYPTLPFLSYPTVPYLPYLPLNACFASRQGQASRLPMSFACGCRPCLSLRAHFPRNTIARRNTPRSQHVERDTHKHTPI